MIEWFTWLVLAVAVVGGLVAAVIGLIGRKPNDVTIGAIALVELLLVAQLVMAIIAPELGNRPTGSLLEFYVYLVSAMLIAPLAVFWALVDRTRWSTVVIGVACLAIAVMVYRMDIIWRVQVA
ncbi:MAG: hypothetical protein JWR53_1645 [Glaciihabitans sp.]|jgi:hypothetical protein|nr:hypothetical protein [Glaciihabitans sp.]